MALAVVWLMAVVCLASASVPTTAWLKQGPASSALPVRLIFAVRQTNTAWLEDTLLAVSDPTSPRYGRAQR
jgi:hypothetical protein